MERREDAIKRPDQRWETAIHPTIIPRPLEKSLARKGTNGVGTNGVTANFMFSDGAFWVLLTCFYIPKSARVYLFPQSVKIHFFCSGPISVDPICPQPTRAVRPAARSGSPS